MGHQDWVVTWLQEKNEHYWRSVQSTVGETARVFVCHVRKDLWLLLSLGSLNLGKGPIWTLTTKGLAHSRQGLALSSHFSCLSVCGPLQQRWGHPGSCSRLPHSTVLVIIFIFTMVRFQVHFWASAASTSKRGQGAIECFLGRVDTGGSVWSRAL